MKRRAIIIGNEGILGSKEHHFLFGVRTDISSFYEFIASDNGGAWGIQEIMPFEVNKVTRDLLKDAIYKERNEGEVDYWLIYFSGHGGSDANGIDYIENRPGEAISIDDIIDFISPRSKVLVITDACRVLVLEHGGKIPSTKYFSDSEKPMTIYRQWCRNLYNAQVENIPQGSVFIGQACSPGQSSVDGGLAMGGVYTNAVIQTAKRLISIEQAKKMAKNDYDKVISYPYVHYLAANAVNTRPNNNQTPTYRGPKSFQPPFCVIP